MLSCYSLVSQQQLSGGVGWGEIAAAAALMGTGVTALTTSSCEASSVPGADLLFPRRCAEQRRARVQEKRAPVWAKAPSGIRKNEIHSEASRKGQTSVAHTATLTPTLSPGEGVVGALPGSPRMREPFPRGTASPASLQVGTGYQHETCPEFLNGGIPFCSFPAFG